ncbi:MAG: CBASS system CD-NTase-associated NAD(+) hydrolase Cap12 [bacterium]
MKKRVFIGCSSEELSIAKFVKSKLDDEFEVIVWDEKIWDKSVFRLNQNFLSDLLTSTLKFDFGILIGTKDDKVVVRGKEYMQARDNILFELGLFIGRLGIEKCAFLVDQGLKIPTDFEGIKLSLFELNNEVSLTEKIDEIRDLFNNSYSTDLNFFPSSTLAATYYENFVRLVCEHYIKNDGFEFNGNLHKDCVFKIMIPSVLTDDLNIQFQRMQNQMKMDKVSFGTPGRRRNIHVDVSLKDGEQLVLLDFPTTLTGINYAIANLLPKVYKSHGKEYDLILNRELDKFIDTLKGIVKRNNYQDFVKIIKVS